MPAADTARLVAELTLKDKFTGPTNKALTSLGRLEGGIDRIGAKAKAGAANLGRNVGLIGIAAVGAIGVAVKTGLDDLSKLESAITSVDGAIAQVGLTGQVTGKQVADWANQIESDIGAAFDDKDITAAATTLIRFGRITSKNLEPALVVMTDLATKTGDVDSAASLLAKALADPTKAAGKLSRAGVVLTKAEQDQIKAFDKAGDLASEQRVLLDALTRSTKGAAAASQGPYQRALSTLNDVAEDARKALAEGFLPVIQKVADRLGKAVGDPAFINGLREFGTTLAGGLDSLIDIATKLPWKTIGESLKIAGAGAKTVLDAFTKLPPWVQTAVITGWGLNKLTGGALGGIVAELGKGLIKGVLGINAGVVNINAGVVNGGGGGIPGGGAAPTAAAGGLTAGAVATTAAVGVILVGGTAISLNAILEEGAKNNVLASKGLTQQEIIAQKYYTANKADQDRIFKQLHGKIPGREVFDSGNAKLLGAADKQLQATGQAAVRIADRTDALRASQVAAATALGSKITDGTSETKGALGQTQQTIAASAARQYAAAQAAKSATDQASAKASVDAALTRGKLADGTSETRRVAQAVRDKDLSVKVNNYNNVSTVVSVRETIKGQTTFKQYSKVIL